MIQEGLAAKAAGDEATATVEAGPRGPAGRGDRQRGGHVAAAPGGRDRRRGAGHGPVQAERRQARRDGARHGLDQDHPGPPVSTVPCPNGHASDLDRLLRRLRLAHRGGRRPWRPIPRRPRRRPARRRAALRRPGVVARAVLRDLRLRLHDGHRTGPGRRPGADRPARAGHAARERLRACAALRARACGHPCAAARLR